MTKTIQLPTFDFYCDNTTKGNALVFTLGDVDIYYSYKTPVAFRTAGRLVVRENEWGPTTGKHLNAIDGGSREAKKARLSAGKFLLALGAILEPTDSECTAVSE